MTTKFHVVITAEAHVVEGRLTGGQVADIVVAPDLTADIIGAQVVADLGYDSDGLRRTLEGNNNEPVIPGRKHRTTPVSYDTATYQLRRRIELFFGKLKENRRLVVRYDKLDSTFLGFIALAIIKAYHL